MPISDSDVVDLLSRLVSIESINPSLVSEGSGEERIAQFVASWLRDAGLEADVQDVAPGRPNAIGRRAGTGGGRTLLLNAHLDTVGVAGMEDPFQPRVEGDRLYGRGAYDMKAGLAAILLAAREIARSGDLPGDLVVTAVADEEYASLGTQTIVETLSADAAIVTEPTGLQLCIAHKGFAWVSIETRGRAAHGSKPELGADAIAHMGRVLVSLESLDRSLRSASGHRLVGTGSLHASLIEGGQELSSYPEQCRLQVERRTIPGETADSVMGEMQTILTDLHSQDPHFSASAELLLWRDPFEVSAGEAIVQAVREAASAESGSAPELYGDTPWMDAAFLSTAGIPTVVFGPGGVGAHAVEEWASISETRICADVLARVAQQFCGAK